MTEGVDRRGFLRTGAAGALTTAGLAALGGLGDAAAAATVGKPRIPGYYRDAAGRAHSRAYFGLFHARSTPGISEPEELEDQIGRKAVINHCFRQPPETPWAPLRTRMLRDKAAGRIPMLSYAGGETPGIADHDQAALARLTEIAAGRRDAAIDGQARALKALGTPVFLRFTWEFDLRYPGPVGVRTHKAAWRHVRRRFQAVGANNVAFVWCPSWLAFSNGRAEAFYPGDTYVDWIGVDGYARSPDYLSFAGMFAKANTFAATRGKPLMVSETGVHRRAGDDPSSGSTAQSAWLDAVRSQLDQNRFSAVKALLYFHVDGDNQPRPNQWRVTSPLDGPAFRSFTALARHPRLKALR
ncbi:MAG: glycosyl hydrolase [Propionibacteriales bacterium]|nr:glycosyl hydrolase [Propionibacteriales bacterium]